MRLRVFPAAPIVVLTGGLALAAVLAAGASPARLAAAQPMAYSDLDGNVYLGTTANGNPTTIYRSDGSTTLTSLAITPDGASVLALSTGDQTQLVLVPAGGGAVADVAGTQDAQDGSISPDGKQVIFSIAPGGSDTLAAGIYSVPIAGGTPKAIVTSPDGATDSLPQLSPDGTQVAFARDAVDGSGTEVVALDVAPVDGGSARQLATGVASTLFNGGRFSFSPDGRKIVFAGSFDNPGLFTVPTSGGSVSQLSSESDYWPFFTADGSTIVFSRDASSPGADDNADTPVDPQDTDTDELWTMNADGTKPAVVAEGDFEALAAVPYLVKGSSGGGTGGGGTGGGGTGGGTGGGGTGGGGTGGGSTTKPGASSVVVAVHAPRYVVTWKGTASSWKVTLKVGRKTLTAKVAGSKHMHTFTLRGGKGAVSATVKPTG